MERAKSSGKSPGKPIPGLFQIKPTFGTSSCWLVRSMPGHEFAHLILQLQFELLQAALFDFIFQSHMLSGFDGIELSFQHGMLISQTPEIRL